MIEFGHATHTGLHRKRNEDTCFADPALGLYLVADGLGGHQHGALAAALARDSVVADMRGGMALEQAIRKADDIIIGHPDHMSGGQPMGTTIAALRLIENVFEAAWVGDSRIYLHDENLLRLSHDHSHVQELIDRGLIDETEARNDPRRNLVTQALGVTAPADLQVECVRGTLPDHASLLLCSDGLTEELDDAAIARCLKRDDLTAQECVDHLVLDALDAGGHDNITVVLVRAGHG